MDKRQKQAKAETKQHKDDRTVGSALQRDMESAIYRAGGTLTGLNFYYKGYEVLLIVKSSFPNDEMVGFSSGGTPGQALRKAEAQVSDGSFRWKTDEWAAKVAKKEEEE